MQMESEKTTSIKNQFEEQNWLFTTKPHLNLRNPKGDRPTSVYLVFRIKEKQYKVALGVKVIPSHFDRKKQQAMVSCALCEMENRNNLTVNNKISEFLLAYQKFLFYLCSQNSFDVKECIDKFFTMATKSKKKKELLSATLLSGLRKSKMGDNSFKLYMANVNQFCDWVSEKKKDATIDDVTEDLLFQYKDYLFSLKVTHKYTGEKVAPQNNSVSNNIKQLSTVFGYCDASTDMFKKVVKSIKNFKQDENQIYITDAEIEKLRNIELKGVDDKVRDLFLFQLSVAQRISDILPLCGKTLEYNDRKFSLIQKKTKTRVVCPIDDIAQSILDKYNNILPVVKYRTIEDHLKTICKACGMTEKIEGCELRNNEEYHYTAEKWQMVGTHTARRAKITNLLKQGVSGEIIRKLSGHKSAAFSRYNRLGSEDAADILLNAVSSPSDGISTPQTNNYPQTERNANPDALKEEIRHILTMFNVPPIEWIELDDIESLYRVMITYENNICDQIGCDYHVLKDLFNDVNLSLRDKVDAINGMINKQ